MVVGALMSNMQEGCGCFDEYHAGGCRRFVEEQLGWLWVL